VNLLIARLKQNLQNNLWQGENSRREAVTPSILTIYDYPDLARVWGNDTSHWDGVINQSVAKQAQTHFTFIKAIDGTLPTNYFTANRAGAIEQGFIVGAYGWLYPNNRVDCKAQALAYHNLLISQEVNLPPVIDFEWTNYGGAPANPNYTDLKIWGTEFNRLGNRTGARRPLLYSAAGYMNQFGQIPADVKALFSGLWIANYNKTAPTMPYGYGANEWIFWQWSNKGDQVNLAPSSLNKKELDLNYFNGTQAQLEALAGISPTISDGYQNIRRYNSDVHIWRGVVSRVHVTNNNGVLIKPSAFATSEAMVIVNGDGWDPNAVYPHESLSLAMSDGTWTQADQFDGRPFSNWKNSGVQVISTTDKADARNLVSGTRTLVKGGVNMFAASSDPEHVVELNPRTAIGYTQDNRQIACVVDGRSSTSAGVTLKQLADIMIECGAWYALELDGGDSSVMIYNGERVSKNGDIVNGVKVERATINSVLLWTEANQMADRYDIIGTDGNNHSVRTSYSVKAPKVTLPGSTAYAVITNTIKAEGGATAADEYIYPANVPDNSIPGGYSALAGDKWRKVYKVGTSQVAGWTAEKHLGVMQGIKITFVPGTPPPVATLPDIKVTIDAGADYPVTVVTIKPL